MDGSLVSEVPPSRWEKSTTDWDAMARLAKENPDKAVLAATHTPMTTIKSVRMRNRPPFIEDSGRIKVTMRNSQEESDGRRYGDVYFEWVPTKKGKK